MKRVFSLILVISLFSGLHADVCSNWKDNLNQSSTSLCMPKTLDLVVNIVHDSLQLDSCKYEWYIKTPSSTSYVVFSTNNATSYVFNDAGSYNVYSKVYPNDCLPIYTDTIEFIRYEQLIPSSIIGEQTICYNTIPSSISQLTPPIGGDGVYTYQWQERIGGDWKDITDATSTTYTPPALKQTTTYRLKIINTCGIVYSNELTITVRPALSAPIISDYNETICYGTSPTQLSVKTPAIGGDDDTFTYQWQESVDNITFTDIEGAIETTYQPDALTQDRYYRVIASSNQGCGSIYSSNITKISVLDDLKITAVGTEPLCYMSSGEIKVMATGAGDDYTYQWQESNDSITFTDCMSNANAATYKTSPSVAGTYYFRCVVSPTYGCASKTSDVITVKVYEDVTPSVITGADTICFGFIPEPLTIETPVSGGDGVYTYQWQEKKGDEWGSILGATFTTYAPPALKQTTTYRLEITNTCGIVYSNELTITVRPALSAPIISDLNETICYGTSPTQLSVETPAIGGDDDTFTYQWQESVDNITFTDIDGAFATIYQPNNLTQDHFYRVVATSAQGCGSIYSSNVTKISVLDDLKISTVGTEPLCYMSRGEIKVLATGAGDDYTYQWQESNDSITFTDCMSNANAATYKTSPSVAGTYYFRCVVSPTYGCASKTSDVITVKVYEDVTPSVITGADTICFGFIPEPLTIETPVSGGDGVYTYQWQEKKGDEWGSILGATFTTYAPPALKQTTTYRLEITNNCGIVYSNELTITVRPALSAPIISDLNETICYGTSPSQLSVVTLAAGGDDDTFIYQWQESIDNTTFTDIDGAIATIYQPNNLTQDHFYRVVATSAQGCGSIYSSNVTKISVLDDLKISTVGTEPLCYMSRGEIKVLATGAGDEYTYQWQQSSDSITFTDCMSNANAATYKTSPSVAGTYYFRCVVSPTYGCASKTSDVITVKVYEEVTPSIITGADTICFGFIPEPLTIQTPTLGSDGVFTYAWMQRVDGTSVFTYIPGATSTTYAPPALFKTTDYKLEITNACGIYESNVIQIYVRDQLSAPIIVGETDTICYNTIPEQLTCTQEALGGVDDSFIYQWQESADGQTYTDILGENNLSYQPGALLTKHFYRLQASSNKQCGVLYSNIIEVNVFDSLRIIATTTSPICFMNSAYMEVEVTGGGSLYSFQWQQSSDSIHFVDIPDGTSSNYVTSALVNGTYYYRCVVTSTKCGVYSRISNVIRVDVFETLSPGTIMGVDSTCYGYAPNGELTIQTAPSGVDGNYSYQWQQRTTSEWENIIDATQTTYLPTALIEPTEYRLQIASICDTLYTNSIAIKINPLPEIQNISGPNEVCYNQHEVYSIDRLNNGYTYQWYVNNNHGEINTETLNTTYVEILWKDPNQKDAVVLLITNDITGCERSIIYDIAICNETAPDRTTIVRKPNSDILVCQEDRDIYYEWGYTDKMSLQEYSIDNSNRRYVLLPHVFDDSNYDYWLTLRYNADSKCYSRSYYTETNDTLISPTSNMVSVPSLIHRHIPISVKNTGNEEVACEIYAISGQLQERHALGRNSYINTVLPFDLGVGMYMMRVQIGTYVETFKLIAQ